jgi:hypothetical protein
MRLFNGLRRRSLCSGLWRVWICEARNLLVELKELVFVLAALMCELERLVDATIVLIRVSVLLVGVLMVSIRLVKALT